MRLALLLVSIIISLPSFAAWQLNNQQSRLSFISIKKTNVAEVHRFTQLSGELSKNAKISMIIDLTSVDTGITIRNERMQKFLFATDLFPQAKFTASLSKEVLNNIAENSIISVTGELSLHGMKQAITVDVMLVRVNDNKFVVSSMQPIIIQAANFNLGAGVEKLQALAKLPSISKAVPVSFVLTFEKH
ncbi:MAG: YceI family protein [Alteromonadaceae bacterium]|nr:YceI family protein [Alteromonadaceae bacterium]